VEGGFLLIKKPLECVLSVYTNSETAIAISTFLPSWAPHMRNQRCGAHSFLQDGKRTTFSIPH
jgi:hypothetical protein